MFTPKSVDEVLDAPLRTFTGFLQVADGGRDQFWEKHGHAYISKVYFLMEHTEDAGQRYNLKQRLEKVTGDKKELSIWYNLISKESGMVQPI